MADYLMEISDAEFQSMRQLIYDRFGINLTDQKKSLLVGRLQKLIRQGGYKTFEEYYDYIIKDRSEKALGELVDRISTNHTYFNREKDHFDFFLRTALPDAVERLGSRGERDLRVWCAGCSSGEEAYMLQMLMLEFFGGGYSRWDAGLLATDISQTALTKARVGNYSPDQVKNIPEELLRRYFIRRDDGSWQVNELLRKEVIFRRFNLMNSRFPFKKPFHIIFCRNVMIYFDRETREALISRFHLHHEPGGYLFIGHSESLGRSQSLYRYLQPAAYQRI